MLHAVVPGHRHLHHPRDHEQQLDALPLRGLLDVGAGGPARRHRRRRHDGAGLCHAPADRQLHRREAGAFQLDVAAEGVGGQLLAAADCGRRLQRRHGSNRHDTGNAAQLPRFVADCGFRQRLHRVDPGPDDEAGLLVLGFWWRSAAGVHGRRDRDRIRRRITIPSRPRSAFSPSDRRPPSKACGSPQRPSLPRCP